MRRSRGFTLIELLVAFAVLGLVAALAFDGLRFAMRAWSGSIERSAAVHEVTVVQRFLRSRLESLHAFEVERGPQRLVYPIEGDADSLSFSAPLTAGAGQNGFQRFTIAQASNTGAGVDLVATWRMDRNGQSDPLDTSEPSREVLIEGVARVEFDYLLTDPSGTTRWLPRWRDRADVPRLIRARIAFPQGDSRSWPELVVAPRVTADANCAFDLVSQQCRST